LGKGILGREKVYSFSLGEGYSQRRGKGSRRHGEKEKRVSCLEEKESSTGGGGRLGGRKRYRVRGSRVYLPS